MVLALTASLALTLPTLQAAPAAAPTAAPAPTSPPASAPATAPAAAPPSAPGTTVPRAEALAQHRAQSQPTLNGPSQVPANTPALRQMSRERDALELVEQTAHHALQDATHRIAAMHAFIERQNLAGALAAYARNFQPLGSQITFETAMRAALDHLATRPPTAPTTDLLHLEQAIEVESATAHSTFNLLNSARRNGALGLLPGAPAAAAAVPRMGPAGRARRWPRTHAIERPRSARRRAGPPRAAACVGPTATGAGRGVPTCHRTRHCGGARPMPAGGGIGVQTDTTTWLAIQAAIHRWPAMHRLRTMAARARRQTTTGRFPDMSATACRSIQSWDRTWCPHSACSPAAQRAARPLAEGAAHREVAAQPEVAAPDEPLTAAALAGLAC